VRRWLGFVCVPLVLGLEAIDFGTISTGVGTWSRRVAG